MKSAAWMVTRSLTAQSGPTAHRDAALNIGFEDGSEPSRFQPGIGCDRMNAELVVVGDVIMGKDGTPMKVLDVEHIYQGDGPGMNLRQIVITLETVPAQRSNGSCAGLSCPGMP